MACVVGGGSPHPPPPPPQPPHPLHPNKGQNANTRPPHLSTDPGRWWHILPSLRFPEQLRHWTQGESYVACTNVQILILVPSHTGVLPVWDSMVGVRDTASPCTACKEHTCQRLPPILGRYASVPPCQQGATLGCVCTTTCLWMESTRCQQATASSLRPKQGDLAGGKGTYRRTSEREGWPGNSWKPCLKPWADCCVTPPTPTHTQVHHLPSSHCLQPWSHTRRLGSTQGYMYGSSEPRGLAWQLRETMPEAMG